MPHYISILLVFSRVFFILLYFYFYCIVFWSYCDATISQHKNELTSEERNWEKKPKYFVHFQAMAQEE